MSFNQVFLRTIPIENGFDYELTIDGTVGHGSTLRDTIKDIYKDISPEELEATLQAVIDYKAPAPVIEEKIVRPRIAHEPSEDINARLEEAKRQERVKVIQEVKELLEKVR